MAISLNHTIVSARDKDAAARFFAEIFALRFEGLGGHFAPVRGNDIRRQAARPLHHINSESLDATTVCGYMGE